MKARHIPNILSASRIPCAVTLPFLGMMENKLWFLLVFGYIGLSDVLDGKIARKFNWQSKLGGTLDSVGDTVYIVFTIVTAILALEQIVIALYNYIMIGVIFVGRAFNQAFTWKKFRRVGFIHTRLIRLSSVPMYFLIPISIYLGYLPNIPLVVFLSMTAITGLEETWLLHIMQPGEYTMSIKSYWEWKRDKALLIEAERAERQEVTV